MVCDAGTGAGGVLPLEPAVDPIFRATTATVRGRAQHLRPEFGCGVVPVWRALPLTGKPVVAVASHAHVGHIGKCHEFAERSGHLVECAGCADRLGLESFANGFAGWAATLTTPQGPADLIADWTLRPALLTGCWARPTRFATMTCWTVCRA